MLRKQHPAKTLFQERLGRLQKQIFEPLRGHLGSQNRSERGSENKQNFGTILLIIFCRSQNRTPPRRGGGVGKLRPPLSYVFLMFLENCCFRMGRVQKSRVQGLRGHSPGPGGEAKASPTTSKLVVESFASRSLKLHCVERCVVSQRRGPRAAG